MPLVSGVCRTASAPMLSHGGSRLNASKPEANPKTSCPFQKHNTKTTQNKEETTSSRLWSVFIFVPTISFFDLIFLDEKLKWSGSDLSSQTFGLSLQTTFFLFLSPAILFSFLFHSSWKKTTSFFKSNRLSKESCLTVASTARSTSKIHEIFNLFSNRNRKT